jgi:hypothetical protein
MEAGGDMGVIIVNGKVRKTKRKNARHCEMCGKPFGPNADSYRFVLKHKPPDGMERIVSPSIRVCKECALPIWEKLREFILG